MKKLVKLYFHQLLVASLVAIFVETVHCILKGGINKNDLVFIANYYIMGIIAPGLLTFFLISVSKNELLWLNYIFGVYQYYIVVPTYIFSIIYSFFSEPMDRHVFWIFPGVVSASYYLLRYHKEHRKRDH